jgi:hypothetical protein
MTSSVHLVIDVVTETVGEHPVHHLPPVHRLNALPRGVQVKDTKPGAGAAAPGFVGIPADAAAHRDAEGRRPGRRRPGRLDPTPESLLVAVLATPLTRRYLVWSSPRGM